LVPPPVSSLFPYTTLFRSPNTNFIGVLGSLPALFNRIQIKENSGASNIIYKELKLWKIEEGNSDPNTVRSMFFSVKIVIEPPACSNKAQKTEWKKNKTITTKILCPSALSSLRNACTIKYPMIPIEITSNKVDMRSDKLSIKAQIGTATRDNTIITQLGFAPKIFLWPNVTSSGA